ncbi:DUF4214 domain-containing protein [Massilia sp. W12]|uniref:DUF4214 domain-containing protein n=1 Tax=Massilia sp. W12 TaxID=3126507 RepID=UPI0030CF1EAF
MQYVTQITGIKLEEVDNVDAANWRFSNGNVWPREWAGATFPKDLTESTEKGTEYRAQAEIFLDNEEFEYLTWDLTPGKTGYQILLHEVGHALGLGHPFDGEVRLPHEQDHTDNTLMSYTSGKTQSTYSPNDLAALHWLYGGDGLGGKLGLGAEGRYLTGTAQKEELRGSGGNDLLVGNGGGDTLYGEAGIDTAVFNQALSSYNIIKQDNGVLTVSPKENAGDSNTLHNVERLRFSDQYLNFDLDGASGQIYRLYQAAFDRKPDASGLGFWFHQMEKNGASLHQIAQGFMQSDEFQKMYGANPDHKTLINLMYQHVLHRTPDAEGEKFWLDTLKQGKAPAEILSFFAQSPENQAQLNGVMQQGMAFSLFS